MQQPIGGLGLQLCSLCESEQIVSALSMKAPVNDAQQLTNQCPLLPSWATATRKIAADFLKGIRQQHDVIQTRGARATSRSAWAALLMSAVLNNNPRIAHKPHAAMQSSASRLIKLHVIIMTLFSKQVIPHGMKVSLEDMRAWMMSWQTCCMTALNQAILEDSPHRLPASKKFSDTSDPDFPLDIQPDNAARYFALHLLGEAA
jgi:hypothetical protein